MKTDSDLWTRLDQLEEEEKDWLAEEEKRDIASELEQTTSFPKDSESPPLSDTLSPVSPPPAPLNIPIRHTSHTPPVDLTSSVLSNNKEEELHAKFTNPGDIFRHFSETRLTTKAESEETSSGDTSSRQRQEPRPPKPRTVTWDTHLQYHRTEGGRRLDDDRPRQHVQQPPPVAIVSKLVCCVCIRLLCQGAFLSHFLTWLTVCVSISLA